MQKAAMRTAKSGFAYNEEMVSHLARLAFQIFAKQASRLELAEIDALKGRAMVLGFCIPSSKNGPIYMNYSVGPADGNQNRLFVYSNETKKFCVAEGHHPIKGLDVTLVASTDSYQAKRLATSITKQCTGHGLNEKIMFKPIEITDTHNRQILLYLEYAETAGTC